MNPGDPILEQMIRKLKSRARLDAADCEAVRALPYVHRKHQPPAYLVREGEPPKRYCSFVVTGLAIRQKHTTTGGRQIVSIHLPGDFLDLQHLFLNRADHNVQALTQLETADIDRSALQNLVLARPAIGRAMWTDALVDASIFREWIVNVGRRDARARIAHLLCEFAIRMEATGIPMKDGWELPMTQEQIGDAVGLTSVHVNRTLKSLAADGLIHRDKRVLAYADWAALQAVGGFSALYLHVDQTMDSSASA